MAELNHGEILKFTTTILVILLAFLVGSILVNPERFGLCDCDQQKEIKASVNKIK